MADEDDPITQRFLAKTPFEDGLGIRGPITPGTPLREIQGAEGGNGSYSIPGGSAGGAAASPSDPELPPAIAKIIVAFNGTLKFCTFYGTVGANV